MAKLTTIDRPACRMLRDELEKELIDLANRLGIRIKVGAGSFTESNVIFKVECAVIDQNGEAQSKTAQDFIRWCGEFGLAPTDLHRTFTMTGKQYKIVGLRIRSRKYPVLCETPGNKRQTCFSAPVVKMYLDNS